MEVTIVGLYTGYCNKLFEMSLIQFKKICVQSFNRPHCNLSITQTDVSKFLKILHKNIFAAV